MKFSRLVAVVIPAVLVLSPAFARKAKIPPTTGKRAPAQMSPDQEILHALNRLAFGPRPGDVAAVQAMGLSRWIEQQFHPNSIPENPALLQRLALLDTLQMSTAQLTRRYPPNFAVKLMVEGKLPWPDDPETRVIVQRLAVRYADKFGVAQDKAQPDYDGVLANLTPEQRDSFENGGPLRQIPVIDDLPVEKQFDLVSTMPQKKRAVLFAAAPASIRRRMESFAGGQHLVAQDLADAKIFRAVYSNRQLEEVLTDFWYNHFNVNLDKGADHYLTTSYERDAIRPFVFGKFRDLLTATAESPAMLFYLDNFQSVRADMDVAVRNPRRAKRGLNENYGRELLELHTLGVNGGYTQKDVTDVARCFTGWTIRGPRQGDGFYFNPKQHDTGEKIVLGIRIPAGGGIEDGLRVIDILSRHPATAHFISLSLATRFVSDNPPPALVNAMAATFLKTDGDLSAVMKTMLASREFWAESNYRAKIKSPFEMVVSALRATDADIHFANSIETQLNTLGEPLYKKVEPTGYSNRNAEWMNSAALLGRMNFALNLTANKLPGVRPSLPSATDTEMAAKQLMGADLTTESRQLVEKGLAAPGAQSKQSPGLIAGLMLGSPDFQRR